MDEKLKELLEAQGRAFDEFKKSNDARIKQIEQKGSADVVTDEKVEKLNGEITRLSDAIEQAQKKTADSLKEIEKKMPRPSIGGSMADDEERKAQHKAFCDYVRKGIVQLPNGERAFESKAMSVGSDPDGGYLVPVETSNRIITRVFDTTPMRQLATVMTIASGSVEFVRDTDEAAASWVGETDSRPDTTTPQVGKTRIEAFELHTQPKATQTLLDDAILDVESWIVNKIADKFARSENNAFINGDGVAKPHGITGYATAATPDASRSWGVLEHVGTGNSADFASSNPADKLFDLVAALKVYYAAGASWMMPRAVVNKIRKFKESTTNAYMWQPGLAAGQPDTLLGYPLTKSEDMPALAANSLSVAFGNFKEGYTIVDRIGIRLFRDPYTAAPYIRFRSTKRVGGDVTNFEAIKLMKFI